MSNKPKDTEAIDAASSAKLLPSLSVDQEQVQRSYNVLPYGPAVGLIQDVLKAGDVAALALIEARHPQITHGAETLVSTSGNKVRITRKTNNVELTLQYTNFAAISGGSNKAAKKMLIFILQEINRQGIVTRSGDLIREVLSFPVKKLVECGMYADMKGARRGFDSAIDGLKGDIQGLIKVKGKERTSTGKSSLTLFPTLSREDGNCIVRLNPDINWEAIAPFYTIIPTYAYKLSNRAFDLLIYICTQARQRVDEINAQGSFCLSLRSVQYALNLPDETKTKNPGEYIKKPIKETVEEILRENDIAKNEGNFNITLVPEGIEGKRISNYLNDGKLQITMQGAYYAYFEDIFKTKSKIIDDKKQRAERIVEQAQIRALERSMENEPKGDT